MQSAGAIIDVGERSTDLVSADLESEDLKSAELAPKRMGPGAFKHRGALHLRFRRRISDRHQFIIKIEHRVAFAFRSRGYDVWIVGGATGASSCCSPLCAETLPLSKVTGLSRWHHAPLQVWSPRTIVRVRCLPFDHMIGRQYPRSGEPKAPLPRQVQRRKCCGR